MALSKSQEPGAGAAVTRSGGRIGSVVLSLVSGFCVGRCILSRSVVERRSFGLSRGLLTSRLQQEVSRKAGVKVMEEAPKDRDEAKGWTGVRFGDDGTRRFCSVWKSDIHVSCAWNEVGLPLRGKQDGTRSHQNTAKFASELSSELWKR